MLNGMICCPKCGGTNVVNGNDNPEDGIYRCLGCKTQFGLGGKHPLSDLVSSIELDIQGFRKEAVYGRFYGPKDSKQYKIETQNASDYIGKLTSEQWNTLSSALFEKIYLDKWKSNYFDSTIIDGTRWTITVRFEKKHVLSVHGCNGFPAYWNDMLNLFEEYFVTAGKSLSLYQR